MLLLFDLILFNLLLLLLLLFHLIAPDNGGLQNPPGLGGLGSKAGSKLNLNLSLSTEKVESNKIK